MTQIHSSRLYEVEHSYKANGDWRKETIIVAGYAMRPNGFHLEPHKQYHPDPKAEYRLHNGRLPEYQPRVFGRELKEAMACTYPPVAVVASIVRSP